MPTTTPMLVRAREIMTRSPVTVPHTATVAEAAALLEEESIHGAPVVNTYGKVIGVVSRTDVARHLRESLDDAAEGPASSVLEALISRRLAEGNEAVEGLSAPVQEAMSERPVTADPESTAGALAELMHREGIQRVFIVSEERLVGVVSASDLMPVLVRYERERRG
ncbi:MAG: CBS domain-containing protein [Planctomycetes bacterium]|nr:CBS domain-containing protein [Planctomycetota bacterium]